MTDITTRDQKELRKIKITLLKFKVCVLDYSDVSDFVSYSSCPRNSHAEPWISLRSLRSMGSREALRPQGTIVRLENVSFLLSSSCTYITFLLIILFYSSSPCISYSSEKLLMSN